MFSSTHKYIWSRNLSKLSEKYCVLCFFFEIVVWIQAKNKLRPSLMLRKLGASKTLCWSWAPAGAWFFWHIMYHIKPNRKDQCVRIYFIVRVSVTGIVNNFLWASLLCNLTFFNCWTLAKQHCIVYCKKSTIQN